MSVNATQGVINPHNFITTLLPGVALLLGLYPIIVDSFSLSGDPLIIAGFTIIAFVIGRLIHSISETLNQWSIVSTPSTELSKELKDPSLFPPYTIINFKQEFTTKFGMVEYSESIKEDSSQKEGNNLWDESGALYTLTNAFVQLNGQRQRQSKMYRAYFEFYRGMVLVSFVLIIVYILIALSILAGLLLGFDISNIFVKKGEFPLLLVFAIFFTIISIHVLVNSINNYSVKTSECLISEFLVLSDLSPDKPPNELPEATENLIDSAESKEMAS